MCGPRIVTVQINRSTVRAEVADTFWSISLGLMFRTFLAPDAGMLFQLRRTADHAFHMWNVRFPLDVIFMDDHGKIVHIRSAQPGAGPFRSGFPVRVVLEVNFGWCVQHGVGIGDRCMIP